MASTSQNGGGIIAGIGLLKFQQWARILALVLAVLHVLSFPIGTALAIYAFWVLLKPETTPLFERPTVAVTTVDR